MPVDPTSIIAEVLGEPAGQMRNPVNAGYRCPYINSQCTKRGHHINGPYPVCSIHKGVKNSRLVCVCPKRFFEANLQDDVVKHAWQGPRPTNPQIAYEVQMKRFGMVDFVIADVEVGTGQIREFVSVELQAVDLTGTVEPAYQALLSNNFMAKRPSYGVNWANVRKRYINQIINKGFYHHHWGTRIVSAIQTPLYDYFREELNFDELSPTAASTNIVFMLYDFVDDPEKGTGGKRLELDRVVGTSHNSLMMGVLYHEAPSRHEFLERVKERL